MKKGFTLTELLLALTIVGVLAVLTVPILMNNIHNKMFATQVKNMVATLEQLAQDEMIAKRTRDLSDTDFADPAKLLSDKHFAIAKLCSSTTSAREDCWKTTATGKDKIQYKYINKPSSNGLLSISPSAPAVILKNGVLLSMHAAPIGEEDARGDIAAKFWMDINGNDKPNIAGRDLFTFYVTNKGHVVDYSYAKNVNQTVEHKKKSCLGGLKACFGALADNGWKMDY